MPSRSIKDWPADDRPREKLLRRGAGALSDAELLAIILRTGGAGASALDHARALIEAFGSFRQLATAGAGDLCKVKGLGPAKAAEILATLEIAKRFGEHEFKPGEPLRGSGDVYAHFRERLASEPREHFYAVLLDNKHRKIKDVPVSLGSLTASIVHPRDVFAPVVREPPPRWSSSTTIRAAIRRRARRTSRSPSACAPSASSWACASSTTS